MESDSVDSGYCKILLSNLNEMRHVESLCDITLKINDTTIVAHRVILSAFSPYFRAMFTQDLAEKKQRIVEFQGLNPQAMKLIVNFAYTGSLCITTENVQLILPAACLLQIKCLIKQCVSLLNDQLHPTNCIGIYRLSELYSLRTLQKSCWKYINQNFEEVYKLEEFHETPIRIVRSILVSDDLNVISEESVFNAVESWVMWDIPAREDNFLSLLLCVRLSLINHKFLQDNYKSNKLIENDVGAQKLITGVIHHKLDSQNPLLQLCITQVQPRCAPKTLFAIGGKKGLFETLSSVEVYMPSLGEWQNLPPLPKARYECGVIATDGKIFIMGGIVCSKHENISFREYSNSVTVWDPETNLWGDAPPMKKCRSCCASTLLRGEIYVLGGYDGESYLRTVEKFCPRLQRWSSVTDMQHTRTSFAAVTLNDYIYAMGGYGPIHKNSVERYSARSNVWELSSPMLSKRMSFGATVLKGVIYVLGGHSGVSQMQSVEKYDSEAKEWKVCTMLPTPRTGMGTVVLNEKIYVIGGHSGHDYLDKVECYDPKQDTWTSAASMMSGRCNFGAIAL